ncbi:MAG: sialidase family protein [Polyangiales bacterium]
MAFVALSSGCGNSDSAGEFVTNQRIIFSDGLHNENTEMIRLGDRILLAFRGGEQGQVGSDRAAILISESTDEGQTFTKISEITMPPADSAEPGAGRDIRDPKLVQMGDKLFLYAIARSPGFTYRDLFKQTWTVRSESEDGGRTWTAPARIRDEAGADFMDRWGFWRFTKRQYEENGEAKETLFATGYEDGDTKAGFFRSEDGIRWTYVSNIIDSYDDAPSEAELQFFGDNQETAVSIVRLDNQGNLDDGQSAICTSRAPFDQWECGRRVDQRLGGPTWVVRRNENQVRNFIFARKHLSCTFKRTAAYELRGDLTDPKAPVEMCEIQELMSSGDTAYTALVPITQSQYLLSWYSTPPDQELAWLEGQFAPSDIWLADVSFDAAPSQCVAPVKAGPCPPPPLPEGTEVYDVSGSHLLSVSPVIWPSRPMFFKAEVQLQGSSIDMTMQPLDIDTKEPVGDAWTVSDVAIESDGRFVADFGKRDLPSAAYPVVDADIPIPIESFVVSGKTISLDGFCGGVDGYAQFLSPSPADRINLDGSKFGAVRIVGDTLPEPVVECP